MKRQSPILKTYQLLRSHAERLRHDILMNIITKGNLPPPFPYIEATIYVYSPDVPWSIDSPTTKQVFLSDLSEAIGFTIKSPTYQLAKVPSHLHVARPAQLYIDSKLCLRDF